MQHGHAWAAIMNFSQDQHFPGSHKHFLKCSDQGN